MKGKVLSIITAILFGATMVASPIVSAATTDTAGASVEQTKPAKTKKANKKKSTKKKKASKAKKGTKKTKKPAATKA